MGKEQGTDAELRRRRSPAVKPPQVLQERLTLAYRYVMRHTIYSANSNGGRLRSAVTVDGYGRQC